MPSPLRNPAFARLWGAGLFAETAEWMLQVALPLHIFALTGSPAATAATMVAGVLPAVALSPVAGVLADRWNRRRLLAAVCAGQALVAVPLVFAGRELPLVYLVMALQSGLAALFEPARGALVPALAGPEETTAANGAIGVGTCVARLGGSAAGGVLLGIAGLGAVVAAYAGALAAAIAVLLPRFAEPRPARHAPALRAWLDGFTEIRRDVRLRLVVAMTALMSVGQGMFVVLFVLFVSGPLGRGEAETGLLRGVQAIGGLAAGLVLTLRRAAPARLLSWGTVAFGLTAAVIWNAPALTTAFGVYIGLFIAIGVPVVVLGAGLLSVVQEVSSPGTTGRVLATGFAVQALAQVAGMLGAGTLVGLFGLTALLNFQAGLNLVAGLLGVVWLVRRPATVEPCPSSTPPATSTSPTTGTRR
ncbi:MFS transporter [Amycolatopsis thermophila]|uniref:MFS family arabinose efflux permease n=1 Tax=Amycolatopsis thermophila TaxID=206084 RepID=A0ABU0F416_9PSEU|nr:MFS transporter [Amycolatopsis thermophila]MDQ0381787.1 putative MFS family arabinose efflux permease [Amycolatopsis thermophila]